MKFIKRFKSHISELLIADKIKKHDILIENWSLNEFGSLDVKGSVIFFNLKTKFDKIPLKFREVEGKFDFSRNRLTSLEGAPQSVGGKFDCSSNSLISLEGGPKKVGDKFDCSFNSLTDLRGGPKSVGGNYRCSRNKINSLEGAPESVVNFCCAYNELTSLEGLPKYIGGNLSCEGNNIRDFEGIGIIMGNLDCHDNPINEIWKLFRDTSKIELLNSYDAIRGDSVILERLNEFLEEIGRSPITGLNNYKCI